MINKRTFSIIIFLFIISCSRNKPKNNKTAYIITKNYKTYLMLTSKRVPLVHDPLSLFSKKLIDDTLLLQIPPIKNGIINGIDIPVEEDYNTYKGYILIDGKKVTVGLQILDIDSKRIVEEPYNGRYDLEILR